MADGLLGVYTDWSIDYEPADHLFALTRPVKPDLLPAVDYPRALSGDAHASPLGGKSGKSCRQVRAGIS